jgi:hypothetical protein
VEAGHLLLHAIQLGLHRRHLLPGRNLESGPLPTELLPQQGRTLLSLGELGLEALDFQLCHTWGKNS